MSPQSKEGKNQNNGCEDDIPVLKRGLECMMAHELMVDTTISKNERKLNENKIK